MKGALLVPLAALALQVAPQPLSPGDYDLRPDSAQALDDLRVEKGIARIRAAPALDGGLKERLTEARDAPLINAALGDVSAFTAAEARKSVRARLQLFHLARLARTPEGQLAFSGTEWSAENLRELAARRKAPLVEYARLASQFGVDGQKRLVVRPGVMIVNPERPVPKDPKPGQGTGGSVWRRGLLFAVAIGASDATSDRSFCSGTIVDRYWVITAAHCLAEKGERVPLPRLSAYLPFQGGNLKVANPTGSHDVGMLRVKVVETRWIGETLNREFPANEEALSELPREGLDLALLRLDSTQVDALTVSVADVKLATSPGSPPVSMVGYGLTNQSSEQLSLAVGVRSELPRYLGDDDADVVEFAAANAVGGKPGSLCGGDSGGGLFSGKLSGLGQQKLSLLAVINGLSGVQFAGDIPTCLATTQLLASLLTTKNRNFVCASAPGAC